MVRGANHSKKMPGCLREMAGRREQTGKHLGSGITDKYVT